jgi:uncharacterized membrane protein YgcG
MTTALHRPICARLGCAYPVLLAGTRGTKEDPIGVARVAAATMLGAFGLLDGAGVSAGTLRAGVAALRARGIGRFGVDLGRLAVPVPEIEIEARVAAAVALGVPALVLPAALLPRLMARRRAEGGGGSRAGHVACGGEAGGRNRGGRHHSGRWPAG